MVASSRSQARFIAAFLVKGACLLIAVSLLVFILVNMSPIDPVTAHVGHEVSLSDEQRQAVIEKWGLDRPVVERYAFWLMSVLEGDWGISTIYERPVLGVVMDLFRASLPLMAVAWVVSGISSFALGVMAALNRGTWFDKCVKSASIVMAATPSFWGGMVLVVIFAVWLDVLPSGLASPIGVLEADVTALDRIRHMVLPILALSLNGMGHIVLHTREKMIKSLASEYTLFAMARGETRASIVFRHNIRNIALPALTLQFASLSELFGGSVFVETVFSYPGVGQAAVAAGLKGDVPLLCAIAVFASIFVYVGNVLADVAYVIVDPQIGRRDHE